MLNVVRYTNWLTAFYRPTYLHTIHIASMTYIPYIDVLLHFPILFVMDPDAMHKKAQKLFLNHRTETNLYHLFCSDYKRSNEGE